MAKRKQADRTNELESLVTPDELEKKWGILKSTQAAMRSRRQIPFTLVGPKMPRYRLPELMAWLEARGVQPMDTGRGTGGRR